MRRFLSRVYTRYLTPKALVLMYHRIGNPSTDVWQCAVSPQHFAAHLEVLRKTADVVPLSQLVADLEAGSIRNRSIAITFDDGYADNAAIALPMLEQAQLPATFFLTSIAEGPFWWDELEHLLLTAPQLPEQLSVDIEGQQYNFALGAESALSETMLQQHRQWKAMTEAPPTLRSHIYYQLWQAIRPLHHEAQRKLMQRLRSWAGQTIAAPNEVIPQQAQQQLRQHPLITIGGHTAHHAALGYQQQQYQEEEIGANKKHLYKLLGLSPDLLAYPYGNYNQESTELAAKLGFKAAFTTNPHCITRRSNRYQLGRFQVVDGDGAFFKKQLAAFFRQP